MSMGLKKASTKQTDASIGKSNTKRKHAGPATGFNFKSYIHKLLKEVNANRTISSAAMDIINDQCNDVYARMKTELENLPHKNPEGHILNHKDIITATRFVYPGEIAKHAVNHITRAINKHINLQQSRKNKAK
jgi:histone H2B